ncbi:MAG TPA: TIGR00180 family glycosyltransferase [Burkholderiales bacterium]|nr:TIGR00180 family glycosyltransferase [Burkholderiales bacterium]
MSVHEDLTILLTLKDRVPFTSRWMSFADKTRFPFKVLIADGGTDDGARELLSDRSKYPNVTYEYIRYSPDRSYPDYYAKIADALGRVRTPYVAMADNDDFFFADALGEAVRFLSLHPDYISCGGQGAIFWVLSSPSSGDEGPLYGNNVRWKCTRETKSIDADSARERMQAQAVSTADTFFYDVKKTAEARKHFEIVRDLGPKDLFIFEQVACFLTAIAGKAKRLDTLYLARQNNSPASSGGIHTQRFGDWFGRMLAESWSEDFTKFVNVASAFLAASDDISEDEARDCVIKSYRMLVAPALLSNILEEPTVTLSMSTVVPVVRRLVRLPESSIVKRLARNLYRRVRWISLDSVYGTEFVAGRVPEARKDFSPILKFLAQTPP